jgi:SAM-dependent methyltransferase
MTYDGIRIYYEYGHLGGNCMEGDPYTYAPGVWSYMIDRFCITSMLDVGSGSGHCPEYFFRKGIKAVALDGLWENVRDSVYPTVQWDITHGSFKTKVDLVHAQEVVEHIDPQYMQHLIDTLKSGRYIFMTHAVPGQGGHHHVNCQPQEYWVELMKANNCYLLDEDTKRIREIAKKEESGYLGSTGLLFCNRDF